MKKFTKLFLSCVAVAALTASIATAAMAEGEVALTGDVAGTYDPATGVVTVTAPSDLAAGTQATLLVYKQGADRTNINAEEDVVGIDQAAGVGFDNAGLKGKPQAPETGNVKYTVALGYNNGNAFVVKTGTLTLGQGGADVVIGDVNLDGDITLGDVTEIVNHYLEAKVLEGDALAAADTNGDNDVTLGDCTCIVNYYVESGDIGNIAPRAE